MWNHFRDFSFFPYEKVIRNHKIELTAATQPFSQNTKLKLVREFSHFSSGIWDRIKTVSFSDTSINEARNYLWMKVCLVGLMVMMSLGKAAAAAFAFFSSTFLKHVVIELKQQHILRQLQETHTAIIIWVSSTWFNQSTILDCWHRKELESGVSQVEELADEMDDNYREGILKAFSSYFREIQFSRLLCQCCL